MVTKFAGVQKCLTHWIKTKKKGKYDPWWFTVNISQYIIIFFFRENDTNEAKGSYHDDCLDERKKYFAFLSIHDEHMFLPLKAFVYIHGHRLVTYLFIKACSCQQLSADRTVTVGYTPQLIWPIDFSVKSTVFEYLQNKPCPKSIAAFCLSL